MKVGKIYKFFGEFEQGEFVVGKFEGFEDGTGFMKFSDIVRNKHCNPSYRPDTIELIAMHLDKDDKGKNWRDYEDEAIKIFDEYAAGGDAPKCLVYHSKCSYNVNKTSMIIEMKDYFNEV